MSYIYTAITYSKNFLGLLQETLLQHQQAAMYIIVS